MKVVCGIIGALVVPAVAVSHESSNLRANKAAIMEADTMLMDATKSRRRASKKHAEPVVPQKPIILKSKTKSKSKDEKTDATKKKKKVAAAATLSDFSRLYEGEDFEDDSPVIQSILNEPVSSTMTSEKKPVHIFGLPNGGTSLLWSMLYLNFGNLLSYHGYVSGPSKDTKALHATGLWRYANIKEVWGQQRTTVQELHENYKDNGVMSVISVIRDPYAWIQSMRNHSAAGLAECVEGEDWLTKPCHHEHPAGFVGDNSADRMYPNFPNVWNNWVSSYTNATNFGFMRRLVITYENLVKNPDRTMERISQFLNVQPQGSASGAMWKMPNNGKGNVEAIDSLVKRSYMDVLSNVEKQQACMRLDKGMMGLYGYPVSECLSFTHQWTAPPANASISLTNATSV